MYKARLVFIGASKRYDSIQLLIEAASSLDIKLELISIEYNLENFHPISELVSIVEGPHFSDPEFLKTVVGLCAEEVPTLFIPFMDAAAVALSSYPKIENTILLVSREANSLSNKILMKALASSQNIQTIPNTEGIWPKIVKPADGFGSKGVQLLKNLNEYKYSEELSISQVIEDFVEGMESTVDAYFSKTFELHSVIARDRLLTEGGEVIHTRTRTPDSFEMEAILKFSRYELTGPLNFQFISSGPKKYLMEINPRLSGGSTASMRAGWIVWRWILEEYVLNTSLTKTQFRHLELFRTRRDHWKYI